MKYSSLWGQCMPRLVYHSFFWGVGLQFCSSIPPGRESCWLSKSPSLFPSFRHCFRQSCSQILTISCFSLAFHPHPPTSLCLARSYLFSKGRPWALNQVTFTLSCDWLLGSSKVKSLPKGFCSVRVSGNDGWRSSLFFSAWHLQIWPDLSFSSSIILLPLALSFNAI